MKTAQKYTILTVKLGSVLLSTDISELTYARQVLVVDKIRKHLSIKLKKKSWVDNLWAIPRKTERGSLRFSMRSYIKLS